MTPTSIIFKIFVASLQAKQAVVLGKSITQPTAILQQNANYSGECDGGPVNSYSDSSLGIGITSELSI